MYQSTSSVTLFLCLTDQMFKILRNTDTASRASACPSSPLGRRRRGILDKASCVLVTSAMRREVGRAGGPHKGQGNLLGFPHHLAEWWGTPH